MEKLQVCRPMPKKKKSIKLQRQTDYRLIMVVSHSICEKGKSWKKTTPLPFNKGIIVKEKKLNDLMFLLQSTIGVKETEHPVLQNTFLLIKKLFYKQADNNEEHVIAADDVDNIPFEQENIL